MSATPPNTRRLILCDRPDRVVADVQALRRDGYTSVGTWTLPQVCRHLAVAVESVLTPPPPSAEQTPEQAATWQQVLTMATTPPGFSPGRPIPNPAAVPPADASDAECDRLIAAFDALGSYPHDRVTSPRFGPVPIGESRRFHLAHASHHLSFLIPKHPGRPGLEYADVAAALADVARLRRGYTQAGQWSLAQNAYHVVASLNERMRPGDNDGSDTPEQVACRPIRDRVLAGNEIAAGLTSPPAAAPPDGLTDTSAAGQAAIDGLLAALERFGAYPGPFPPHRLFGHMSREQNVRHQLVHAAHHLSHLVPRDEEGLATDAHR